MTTQHTPAPNGLTIIHNNQYEDGTFSALVKVFGFEYSINGGKGQETRIFGTGGANGRVPQQWQRKEL